MGRCSRSSRSRARLASLRDLHTAETVGLDVPEARRRGVQGRTVLLHDDARHHVPRESADANDAGQIWAAMARQRCVIRSSPSPPTHTSHQPNHRT